MPYPNCKHFLQVSTCLLVSLICNTSFSAEVSFWSLESLSSDEKGSFAEIWVRCAGDDSKIYVRKRAGSRNWCAANLPELCSSDKREMSRQVCADDYSSKLAISRGDNNPSEVDTAVLGYINMSSVDLNREQARLQSEQVELESKARELSARRQALRQKKGDL